MADVFAVANQKGGVGKTTTAVNISACLAEKGKKVLLIDIDSQGNATSGLGLHKNGEFSTYDVLINNTPIKDIMQKTSIDNLFVCPSGISLAGAEIELVSAISRETKLKAAIEEVNNDFDYIIMDCPPSLGLLTLNALTAAQAVIVPIQCEYYALEGLGQLMDTINIVKKHLNKTLEVEGVVLTMFDARTNLSIQVVEEVKKHFNNKVYKTIIPRSVRLSEAPSHGLPVIKYDDKSRGAICYMELADEIINKSNKKEETIG